MIESVRPLNVKPSHDWLAVTAEIDQGVLAVTVRTADEQHQHIERFPLQPLTPGWGEPEVRGTNGQLLLIDHDAPERTISVALIVLPKPAGTDLAVSYRVACQTTDGKILACGDWVGVKAKETA